jgi:photosystem II stability/assembly factor-like uncharacterized protein
MRTRLSLFGVLLLLPIALLTGQWQSMGPAGGDFRDLAVAPANDNIQYLASNGSYGIIWKTSDAGNTWNRAGAVGTTVYSLAVDPGNANIVYAGAYNYIYRSTNAGATWSQQTPPSSARYIQELKVHPTAAATVMATCYQYVGSYYHAGFLKSTNSGGSWTILTLSADTSFGFGLAVDPSNPNNIYVCGYRQNAGTSCPVLYKSTDGGSVFAPITNLPGGAYCHSVAVHQTNSNYVYAGTNAGIYRSTDAGAAWTLASSASYNYSMTTTPADANLLYSGGSGVIYRSTDAGATWTSVSAGLNGSYFYGLTAARSNASIVYAANNTDFYRSTNTGANWAIAHNGLNTAPVTVLSVAPSAPGTIYVDNNGETMYRSGNGGAGWTPLTKPLSCGSVCALPVHHNDPNTVLALEGSG